MRVFGYSMLLIVLSVFSTAAPGEEQGGRPGAQAPPVEAALEAKRDLWGELAIRQPNGPSYAFFEKLLPPLRYVDAAFRHYPLALAAPLAPRKARVISNGSAINPPGGLPDQRWHDYPFGITFHVGDEEEVFGSDLSRLAGPTFDEGYRPIVRLRYAQGDAAIEQEAFVPVDAPFAESAAVFVRFSLAGGTSPRRIDALFHGTGPWTLHDGVLTDAGGDAVLWAGDGWKLDAAGRRLTADLAPNQHRFLAVFSHPLAKPPPGKLSGAAYDKLRDNCTAEWDNWIGRCMNIEVPEEIVNRAWKAVIIANLMLATGDEMSYSAANAYARLYEAESGDAVRALLVYGLADRAKAMTNPLLKYVQQGLGYHDAAFKLQLLSHVYWITRDADFVRSRRELWEPSVRVIVTQREKESGLLPKENYAGDVATQVYSLNSNANAWRGVRDIAAVLHDMGEVNEAKKLSAVAAEFRAAIIAALDKSERRDVEPAFIPIALFGAEEPYDRITESMLGSYWNLLIPYVLSSGILDDRRTQAVLDYLHTRGGISMGLVRFHQHSGLFANEEGLDDMYSLRYVQELLVRDEVDRALVSFYGKLAQGFTRDTFVGGEGTGLKPLDRHGRPMYLPPNATGNALFLTILRELLVQDQDMDEDGKPETLRLLFATPRAWLADGQTIRLEKAPTAFGLVTVVAKSQLSKEIVTVDVVPPERAPASAKLRIRLPDGWSAVSASVGDGKLQIGDDSSVDVSARREPFTIQFKVVRR